MNEYLKLVDSLTPPVIYFAQPASFSDDSSDIGEKQQKTKKTTIEPRQTWSVNRFWLYFNFR